ncbi:outer dense fiber protein 3-like protein 1 [Ahaetulla prasina]|uniref:outer dense fiber protein 3-like protein 1 n=1 Tax=Ahaetulla prasina TaxID=499056 RepID=UPI00264A013E|nr:outer dense fiber protein 3-like protein 1 [Ahaetulla prasina]XP_058012831.1 outer dense fiber protein 3-like protein 1 [Ahaetulla prasina]
MATSALKKPNEKVTCFIKPGSSPNPVRAPGSQKKYALISAKFKGPGPGKYNRYPCTGIKNHDCTKYAEPAYTMRVKSSPKTIMVLESPGPCYYVDPSVSRLGIWRPVSFFMQQRGKSTNIVTTPSPNEYHVEKLHPIDELNAPAYTIGARTPYWLNNPTPAPNKYTLPATLGPMVPNKRAAPCLSITSIAPGRDYMLRKGPGPAAYTIPEPDVYLRHQPSYTLSQRLIPSSKEHTPGPLDYSPEQVTIHKPRAPCFSLGVRHSEYSHGTPTVCLIQE